MIRFRSFVLWANLMEYTRNNPFKKYQVGESIYGTPVYISNEERRQLYALDLSGNPKLALCRDMFVFPCLIGCRIGDLYKMTWHSIINGCIEYIPRKTRDRPVTVRVPLNETAYGILNRYRDPERDLLFPLPDQCYYNKGIRESFRLAGLTRMVTVLDQRTRLEVHRPLNEVASSHMARRSFIGNIYKQVKDPNLVESLSGHRDGSRAFARYRTIDDDMKRELIGYLG
ncbi:site-specific integrase [Alistipes sp. OttesenSCG-928-B03]|nr:site-specific integrase [Alistipes sp. OttesenSCG-928-B03]